jgi:hypothetical protein
MAATEHTKLMVQIHQEAPIATIQTNAPVLKIFCKQCNKLLRFSQCTANSLFSETKRTRELENVEIDALKRLFEIV